MDYKKILEEAKRASRIDPSEFRILGEDEEEEESGSDQSIVICSDQEGKGDLTSDTCPLVDIIKMDACVSVPHKYTSHCRQQMIVVKAHMISSIGKIDEYLAKDDKVIKHSADVLNKEKEKVEEHDEPVVSVRKRARTVGPSSFEVALRSMAFDINLLLASFSVDSSVDVLKKVFALYTPDIRPFFREENKEGGGFRVTVSGELLLANVRSLYEKYLDVTSPSCLKRDDYEGVGEDDNLSWARALSAYNLCVKLKKMNIPQVKGGWTIGQECSSGENPKNIFNKIHQRVMKSNPTYNVGKDSSSGAFFSVVYFDGKRFEGLGNRKILASNAVAEKVVSYIREKYGTYKISRR